MTQNTGSNRLISEHDEDSGDDAAFMVARPQVKASPTRNPRRREGRGSYPGRRQVTSYIDQQLFLWLKSIHAQTGKPMIEIFEEALTAYVNSYAAQKKFNQG